MGVQDVKLSGIADAIRAKEQSTEAIPANEFASRILALDTSGLPDNVHTISVSASDPAGGSVAGGGISSSGMTVTVSATPADTHEFDGWKENGTTISSEEQYTFQVDADRSLVAGFAERHSFNIYGVEWDGSSTTKWTRTDDAATFTDPVPYVAGATNYSSPFDTLQPWAGMVKENRTGGVMVKIPKFWYRLTQNGTGLKIQIADAEVDGFVPSPMHMDRGDGKGERDVAYIGRYHCASNFKSETGGKPKVGDITRADFRTNIHNLGANIWQGDFAMRFTIWLLYLVEFADWNTQKTIGSGCGLISETLNMGYTDSMPYHTGTTQNSRDIYGLGTQYRNIEGLWDICFDFCDGCYNGSNMMNIILNPNNFSDTSGGIGIGTPISGWPSAFNVVTQAGFPMIIPSVSNGAENKGSCDEWSFYTGYPVVLVGGASILDSAQGNKYGLFNIGCIPANSSSANRSSRLQELP